jgi:hypothetical protein
MSRPLRLGLAVLVVLLVVFGGYSAYWLILAGRIEDGVAAWQQSARAEKIDVSWRKLRVAGFPLAFRVEIEGAELRDGAISPPPELRVPGLSGTARPWDFAVWQLNASQGLWADLAGGGERPPLKLAARSATGTLSVEPDAKCTVWLRLDDASAEAGDRVAISSADAWIIVPPDSPRRRTDPSLAIAVDLRQVQMPVATQVLGDTIDRVAFGITVKGAIAGGPLSRAFSAWRDAGGTIELDNLRLKWGGLGATATGTITLDQEMQPIGGFSGAIEGYDQILTALVQSGRMRASEAGLARLALTMLAKAGPDGRPAIATAFTIQGGQMFLGPAKLGKAPRIAWD